jgi:hypothetical protein
MVRSIRNNHEMSQYIKMANKVVIHVEINKNRLK